MAKDLTEKRKVGRPSGFKPEYVEIARKVCEAFGAIDIQIADVLGVSVKTLYTWKLEYPEFRDAIKKGKDAPDERVEDSLYHRAIGYTYDAVKIFNGAEGPVLVPYREHVPPDPTSAIFWLKNRRPAQWRDKHEVEHKAVENLTSDQLKAEILAEMSELGILPTPAAIPDQPVGIANRNGKGNGTSH